MDDEFEAVILWGLAGAFLAAALIDDYRETTGFAFPGMYILSGAVGASLFGGIAFGVEHLIGNKAFKALSYVVWFTVVTLGLTYCSYAVFAK